MLPAAAGCDYMTGGRKGMCAMLVDLKRIVAYICPFCSNISSKVLSIFNFSGRDKVQLICPTHGCHETCVYITKKNSKYKLDIECPLCGETHSYTVSAENFWNKPLLTYKCPAAGIDVFFVGERSMVEQVLDENSDVYSDIIDEFDDEGGELSFNLLYAIIERLSYLIEHEHVSCVCGSIKPEFEIIGESIALKCVKCKRSKPIEISEKSLAALLNTTSIIIGK